MTTTTHAPSPDRAVVTTRDASVDFFRAAALAIVVLGHWFLAVVHWHDDHLDARNLLDAAPATQWATWLFQPMPLFFAVGGWAAARSWANRSPEVHAVGWVQQRLLRLLVPASTYVVVAAVVVAGIIAAMGDTAAPVGSLLGMHLWFLAVYVPVTAAMPAVCALVARYAWRVPLVLGVAVVLVDIARFGGHVPGIGWANFAFLWLGFAAAGAASAIHPPRRRDLATVAVGGIAVLIGVVAADWYPHSMVGVGDRSNNTPPTVALGLLGLAQVALAALAAPRVRRWLATRAGAARSVTALGTAGMHLYLWHLCAVVFVAAAMRSGVGNLEPLTPAWWAARPVWWIVLALITVPIAVAALRLDLRRFARTGVDAPTASWRVVAATLVGSVAFATIALGGLTVDRRGLAALIGLVVAVRLISTRQRPVTR